MTILDDILAHKRAEVADARDRVSMADIEAAARAAPPVRSLFDALARPGMQVIAEHKRASPSKGVIREDLEPTAVAREYVGAGAAAISVLTDERYFRGSLDHLRAIRATAAVPLLRKDFVIDRYQVHEARAAGADAILLIVAALDDTELCELGAVARELGMDVLTEIHDADEALRAVALGSRIIGVNHRDLRTFQMDMTLVAQLRPHVPRNVLLVGESGIATRDDVAALAAAGADAILVGESLMRQPSPGQALRELLA